MKLLFIAALCLVLIERSLAATGITVTKTIGDCACSGVEIKDGSTQREFKLSCKKTKKDKKKTVTTWHTSCIYGGDPHPCPKYNKNQSKFYQGLIDVMAKDYCDETLKDKECKTKQTYHTENICTEIPYTFNKAGA